MTNVVGLFNKLCNVPAGKAANAWLVGANTVTGPVPCRLVTIPPAWRATPSVLNSGVELITWAIVNPETSVVTMRVVVAVPVVVSACPVVTVPVAVILLVAALAPVIVPVPVTALVAVISEGGIKTLSIT